MKENNNPLNYSEDQLIKNVIGDSVYVILRTLSDMAQEGEQFVTNFLLSLQPSAQKEKELTEVSLYMAQGVYKTLEATRNKLGEDKRADNIIMGANEFDKVRDALTKAIGQKQ